MPLPSTPAVRHLVEASLYASDLVAAAAFYENVLGLECIGREAGRHAFFRVGEGVLLLFDAAATSRGGSLPSHGTSGAGHVALGIDRQDYDLWRRRLEQAGVQIEKQIDWPRGGKSLYFRDPSGNSLELVTPGCWGLPSGW
jgi:catechol 2,3-dioxygenase-like lactoylglutathione lyase family enzyme